MAKGERDGNGEYDQITLRRKTVELIGRLAGEDGFTPEEFLEMLVEQADTERHTRVDDGRLVRVNCPSNNCYLNRPKVQLRILPPPV